MANFLNDLDNVVFGGARRRDKRTEENHELNMQRIQQLIANDKSLNAKRDALLNKGSQKDPRIEGLAKLGKLKEAEKNLSTKDRVGDLVLDPAISAFISDLGSEIKADIGVDERSPVKQRTDKKISDTKAEVAALEAGLVGKRDIRSDFSDGTDALGSGGVTPGDAALAKKHNIDTSDFAQESTEVSPKQRKALSFDDLGIQNADDQQAFQEMSDALGDKVNLGQEASQDPENFKRTMEAWKAGKLSTDPKAKNYIGKALSFLQQQARTSLGIT